MLTPTLYDFIATVPKCSETTCLAEVVDIFTSRQCDRLMMVSEQHCPMGVVHLRRLIPQFMTACEWRNHGLETGQLRQFRHILEPLVTIPAQLSVDQLESYLQEHLATINTGCDWALVDPEGKFLGIVDHLRLWQYLAAQRIVDTVAQRENTISMRELDALARLLERLPWPLMLLTGNAEVLMKNPAWWQHFGAFSAPEALRQEIEASLKNSAAANKVNEQGTKEASTPAVDVVNSQTGELSRGVLAAAYQPKSQEPQASESSSAYTRYLELEAKSLREVDDSADENSSESRAATSNQCQIGTEPGTCTCNFVGQNGQERVWQFVKIPLMSLVPNQVDGEQLLWLLLATDVTKEQQLASELAAKNADLIHLNRLKDEFLACISHELKTPLTAVLGLSTLLKDQAMGQLNERQARYAHLIHQSGRHLMTVVNDILDLTRMETGQLELTLQPVQIRTVCDRALGQAKSIQLETKQAQTSEVSTEPSNHRFTLSIEPGLDSCVADELRLRQMLVHLLANAFKFTETGGEIGLQVSRWEGWIAFTVWDTGIGIPEHQQHLIFQKFQQLENPLTRRFEGTGLGLVLTRALARLHGGDVSFLSTEGKGSQFTLLLPPSPPCKGAGGAGGAGGDSEYPQGIRGNRGKGGQSVPTTSKRIVLVVEAAPRFIENLTEQLNNLGYRFVIARSGTEALEKARRLQPRVILLNPFLPLLSGWDVLTLLKSDPVTSQISVIVTATRAEREQAFLNRADDFLSLPVQQQVLHQLLTRFCAETQISPYNQDVAQKTQNETPLTILRLVDSHSSTEETSTPSHLRSAMPSLATGSHQSVQAAGLPSSVNYRVLEADDLEQAALLARIWQPNVVLLDLKIPDPVAYLQQLSQQPSLKSLPLVTLEETTTQAANQIALAVFPCLTAATNRSIDTLLPVLEIAAGSGFKPSLLVIDLATLPELSDASLLEVETLDHLQENHSSSPSLRSEWFQALLQYLHTAGFRGIMGRSWAAVLQQIRQQSVDLLLICLSDPPLNPGAIAALKGLGQQHNLPPVLVLDQQTAQGEIRQQFYQHLESTTEPDTEYWPLDTMTSQADVAELSAVLGAIATQILPSSLSMEELLTAIKQSLAN